MDIVQPWERNCRQDKKGEGKMNLQVMYQNLLDFKEIMDKNDVPFVLIFGTLLGVVRDNDLIHTDTDVDVACFEPDHKKMLNVVIQLKSRGFYIPDRNECPLRDHFLMREQEKIEIWWFTKVNKEWFYGDRVRYPERYFDKTEVIRFLDENWTVPSSCREFLELTYGKDWTIPQPKGSYILGQKK